MKRILIKLAVRFKLLFSFLLLAFLILILGGTAIVIQQSIKKNQNETLASINLSDAFFEGKYFLRADMHIHTEIVKTQKSNRLDYWWGEHEFQIIFFNDQIKKIEAEFNTTSFGSDTLKSSILSITEAISSKYEMDLLPVFDKIKDLKSNEIRLTNAYNSNLIDSTELANLANQIKTIKAQYESLNSEVTKYGLEIITLLDQGKDIVRVLVNNIEISGEELLKRSFIFFLVFTVLGILFSVLVATYISGLITRPVNKILKHVDLLGKGEQPDSLNIVLQDEFSAIQKSLNTLTKSLVDTSNFAKEIGQGNFDSRFEPMSEKDILGNSLIQMRASLNNARNDENERRVEDKRRSWAANGLTKFAELMRQSGKDLKALSYELISNLTDYVGASQAALFVINNEDEDDVYYEVLSAVAYNRNKIIKEKIREGEGLVGRVIFEKQTIYLQDVPSNYVKITSGLGDANPNVILLVPIKLEDNVNGVIELVSFNEFEPYKIEFIEKVGESIASFISTIKTNERTTKLINESQKYSEELAAQEEEMRQNLEELQATQEEAKRREEERMQIWDSIGLFVGIIEANIDGRIINANNKACSLLNMTQNELNDSNYKTLFIAGDTETLNEWNNLKQGKEVIINTEWQNGETKINLNHEITLAKSDSEGGNKIIALIRENK